MSCEETMDTVSSEKADGAAQVSENEILAHRPGNTENQSGHKRSASSKSNPSPSPKSEGKGNKAQAENAKSKASDQAQGTKSVSKAAAPQQSTMAALPDFIIRRNELFEELMQRQKADLLAKEHSLINVVIDLGLDKDGKPRPLMPVAAKAWESTPGSFLRHVDKDVSTDVVIAKVDGKELWDLDRPLEYDCKLSYLPFTSSEGRNVFWHSSAHVLGEAAECQYGCLLSHGPPVDQGFFYDMALAEGYGSEPVRCGRC